MLSHPTETWHDASLIWGVDVVELCNRPLSHCEVKSQSWTTSERCFVCSSACCQLTWGGWEGRGGYVSEACIWFICVLLLHHEKMPRPDGELITSCSLPPAAVFCSFIYFHFVTPQAWHRPPRVCGSCVCLNLFCNLQVLPPWIK